MNNRLKGLLLAAIIIAAALPLAIQFSRVYGAQKDAPPVNENAPWNHTFENDPEAQGYWVVADFVNSMDEFQPGTKHWKGRLALDELILLPDGRTDCNFLWSKGTIWFPEFQKEGKYICKDIDGKKFLFMEWISGDVAQRGRAPSYYVFQPSTQTYPFTIFAFTGSKEFSRLQSDELLRALNEKYPTDIPCRTHHYRYASLKGQAIGFICADNPGPIESSIKNNPKLTLLTAKVIENQENFLQFIAMTPDMRIQNFGIQRP